MAGHKQNIGMIRRAMGPALALIVIGTFAGHAVAGPNGLLAWGGYHRDLQVKQAELAKLDATRAQLRHRSSLLDPRKADAVMAVELVRRDVGRVRAEEVILAL
jgi:cell division protein FtsB